MKPGSLRIAACAALLGALSACGFHLRQPPNLPPQMRYIFISITKDGGGNLMRDLRRNLATDNTTIVDDPGLATAYLKIDDVSRTSRLMAISGAGSTAGTPVEYRVTYQVEFSLLVGNRMLIEPQTLVLTRTYNYKIADAIGNQEQEEGLYNAMSVDMAQLIVFRIQAAARAASRLPVAAPVPAKGTTAVPVAATRPRGN